MNEKFLQFIWQHQYFNHHSLLLESGENLSIINTGKLNTHQGPDFLEASVRIDDIQLIGNIEVHILASDWIKHNHQHDKQYKNIIVHVVWKNDIPVKDYFNNPIPVLVLEGRISQSMLLRYQQLIKPSAIPCHQSNFPSINVLNWLAWKERLLAERLEHKSLHVLELFKESNKNWEEVFWWMIARNFGVKVNAELFESIAKSLPIKILSKHKHQLQQLEALLMGQANLLVDNLEDDYYIMLQKEYAYLQKLYHLKPINIQPNFLRMRPANFPTIRLSQLAVLIQQSLHLFSKLKEIKNSKEAKLLFSVISNDYWHYHYRFNQLTEFKPKVLGSSTINNILINTVVPVFFAYGIYNKQEEFKEKAMVWLNQIPPEVISLIYSWDLYDLKPK